MAQKAYKGRTDILKNLKPMDVVQLDEETMAKWPVSAKASEFFLVEKIDQMYGSYSLRRSTLSSPQPVTIHYLNEMLPVKVLTGIKANIVKSDINRLKSLDAPPRTRSIVSGADPEIFVSDENGNNIPAWMFLPPKESPAIANNYEMKPGHCPGSPVGGNTLYWDGFQAEFTVKPFHCLSWTLDSVQRGLAGILKEARKHNPKAVLSNRTVIPVDEEVLKSADQKYIQFGCMPSYNIYGLTGNGAHGRDVPFRFAGGHLHFGIDKPTDDQLKKIIKTMDATVGLACVSMFEKHDVPVRRDFYGLAGEYRLPAHGIEYRTLSNAWLMHPLLANLVYELGRMAIEYGKSDLNGWRAEESDVIKAIQTCDVPLARKILKENDVLLERMYLRAGVGYPRMAADLVQQPIENFIAEPANIEKNWLLTNPNEWMTHCDGEGKNISRSGFIIQGGGKV